MHPIGRAIRARIRGGIWYRPRLLRAALLADELSQLYDAAEEPLKLHRSTSQSPFFSTSNS